MPTELPSSMQAIIADFRASDREEKLELLLEYSDRMPELPARLAEHRRAMDRVHECMTPVSVYAEHAGGGLHFFYEIPQEAPTIRGYAAILAAGLAGIAPATMLEIPMDLAYQLGLQGVLTGQRLNGISALLAHMKRLAVKELNDTVTG